MPNAAPFVDGVVFSRGQVVPALNLRARFGFERAAPDLRTRLLVVQSEGRSVGLVVDAAHRGLGTASCGPDTFASYLVPAGVHRWSWTLRVL